SAFLLGNRMMESLAEAESLYRKALDLDPDNAAALIGIGSVLATRMFNFRYILGLTDHQISEMTAAAMAFLDAGLLLQPDSALAHSSKGLTHGAGMRWREAMQEYEIARSIDPTGNLGANLPLGTQAFESSLGKTCFPLVGQCRWIPSSIRQTASSLPPFRCRAICFTLSTRPLTKLFGPTPAAASIR